MSTDSMTSLRKTALVTGAAKRIGRVIALALAQRGWDVVVHYGSSAREAHAVVAEIEALGQRALALSCKLDDEAAVKILVRRASA
ncbi:SDR family NAD(P)-dependent oxidoreductase, partial [Herminiimonas sp.]|uniref:SDR family NAD(P)-dependent oxidoreductase n=1 Tax=Herminiimonas sp. TaxID=1926289 RepID=UPI002728593D